MQNGILYPKICKAVPLKNAYLYEFDTKTIHFAFVARPNS